MTKSQLIKYLGSLKEIDGGAAYERAFEAFLQYINDPDISLAERDLRQYHERPRLSAKWRENISS